MTQTTARIKKLGKNFEIIVDMERAVEYRKTGSYSGFLEIDKIFSDSKKGFVAPSPDLEKAFGTEDAEEIAKKIVKEGEILTTQEYRDKEHEKKFNQVVDFLSRNSFNPKTGNPHPPERIKNALEQAHVNIKNVPIENQINEIIDKISPLIPIKLQIKKIKIMVPPIYTGKVYGLINPYKERENWLNNGSLEVIVNIPAGLIMEFYDKLNSLTHGGVMTEEVKGE